jgi:hypothetical protein
MNPHTTPEFALAAVALRNSYPDVSVLEVLDHALRNYRPVTLAGSEPWALPGTPFGSVLAEAFDKCMTPDEWAAWGGEGTDIAVRDALHDVWLVEVVGPFLARYRADRRAAVQAGAPGHRGAPAVERRRSFA